MAATFKTSHRTQNDEYTLSLSTSCTCVFPRDHNNFKLTRAFNYEALTEKFLVFWIDGRLGRWSLTSLMWPHMDSTVGHFSHDSLNISFLSGKTAVVFWFSQSTGSAISHSLHSFQARIPSL